MKKTLKILSVALTVVLIIGIFSCATPVFAAEVTEKDSINSTVEQFKTQVENSENKSLYEIEEERDEFTKVFQNSDGTKTAIVSATPIHYETSKGWEDIDNTLVEETEITGKVYKNKNNAFTTTIPQELSSDKKVKIEKGEYSISFELKGTDVFKKNDKSKGSKKKKVKNAEKIKNGVETDFLDKTVSVSFENVGENTSVEYAVTSTGLKENIILNQKPNEKVTYKYSITAKKLNAELKDDNSVAFKNSAGQAVFQIPAPVMYDAENIISTEIDVELTGKNGKYTLTYVPSYEWLSGDIKYPVVIDPVINTIDEDLGVSDAYVDSYYPTKNYGSETALAVSKSNNQEQLSYFSLANDYIIQSKVKIKSVTLSVNYSYGLFIDDSFEIGAYPITSTWTESNVTYNTKPSIGTLVDKKNISSSDSNSYLTFDVTKAYTSGSSLYGIALKATDDSANSALLVFDSSEYQASSHHPYFEIEYYESQGVEEQFDYHAFDVGRAGTVYFNDFTEQIYIERDELGLSGINMPVQIKRYFNSGFGGTYSDYHGDLHGILANYGFGWRTNYNQTIEYHKNINDKEYILYCNGNGQTTYFEKTDSVSNGIRTWEEVPDIFSNSDGYTLYLPTIYDGNVAGRLQYATIKDSKGQTYEFNLYGLLTKIKTAEENSENCITVSYTSGGLWIDKITDGAGREYRFSYTEYEEWFLPLLTSIQAFSPSGSAITVTNDSGAQVPYKMSYTYNFPNYLGVEGLPMLASATYPDGETVNYSITNNLTTIQNIDGYTIQFRKYNNGTGISELVYTEGAEEPVNAGELKVVSTNSPYEKAYWDPNNVIQTKQFDLYGRVINVINDDGSNVPRTYSEDIKTRGNICYDIYVDYERSIESDEINLITNGDFTTNLSGWSVSQSSNVARTEDYDCNEETETPGSLQITGQRNNIHYAQQIVSVENGVAGDEYYIDYFVKNGNSHMVPKLSKLNTVIVEARKNVEGNETWEAVAWIDANPFNGNWQKYSYSFDIDFPYNEIRVMLVYYFQYGNVRYDNISLVNTYKVTVADSSGTNSGTDNENPDTNTGASDQIGCDCDGCITPDCPCTACSDNCTRPYCNRGYSFENTSQGISFAITDGEKTMGMEQNISGNYYDSQKDINGLYTGYSYNQMNGQLKSMSNGEGEVTNFSYDAMSRLNKVSNDVDGLTSGNKMETSYNYEDDRIESITHNGFSYNYEYDVWGNPTSVKVGEQPLVSYTYDTNNKTRDRVNRITYGNGDYTDYGYNTDGNIETIKSYSSDGALAADYIYTYGDSGRVEKIKNVTENTEVRYTENGFEQVILNSDGTEKFTIYSKALENDGKTVENFNGIEYTKDRDTVRADSVTGETTTSGSLTIPETSYNLNTTTDYFGRTQSKDLIFSTTQGEDYKVALKNRESFEYADDKNDSDYTTALVSKYSITHGLYIEEYDEDVYGQIDYEWYEIYNQKEYLYDYDYNGNITRIRLKAVDEEGNESLTELSSYTYDNIGQLVRENNADINKTYVYVYDKGGNIAQKKEYAYTTEALGEPLSTVDYTYDSVWKDKLTAYGEAQIQTDEMGNPLNCRSVNSVGDVLDSTLEWNGRQLSAFTFGGSRYEYFYNSDGLRTSVRMYNSTNVLQGIQYYIWDNGKLLGYYIEDLINGNDTTVKMLYDNAGEALGFKIDNVEYDYSGVLYFEKNLQGDIRGVYDSNGRHILQYHYDAWGNISISLPSESLNGLLRAAIALSFTPITYRGYMYDPYTGLYYLQSRYYNPAYGRFLNADSIMKTGEPLGANIFAYCKNNPVNFVDYDGRDALSLITNILYLLVVVAVMEADDLLDEFDYILEGAIAFSYKETTIDGITDLVATFMHNDTEEDFECYYVHIQMASIASWESWISGAVPNYQDFFVDSFGGLFLSILSEVLKPLGKIILFSDLCAFLVESPEMKKYDYVRQKISQAEDDGLNFVVFVDKILCTRVNFWGNIKTTTKYNCIDLIKGRVT